MITIIVIICFIFWCHKVINLTISLLWSGDVAKTLKCMTCEANGLIVAVIFSETLKKRYRHYYIKEIHCIYSLN